MINWPANRAAKKNAFVVLSTDFGSMIVNRFDYNISTTGTPYGVGYNLFETSAFDPQEINMILQILLLQKQLRGDGVVMIDGGANIGVHALAAGRLMQGWGSVISFEAQERIFYALAGNVAINNLFNVQVKWNALSDSHTTINIPVPNYLEPSSFGSLEMQYSAKSENIGQTIDMSKTQPVQAITIDSLQCNRVDFIKLDVEGMEEQVLSGAAGTINNCKPVLHIEKLKSNGVGLSVFLDTFGYVMHDLGANILCIHKDDKIRTFIK